MDNREDAWGGRKTCSSGPDLLSPLHPISYLGRKPELATHRAECV